MDFIDLIVINNILIFFKAPLPDFNLIIILLLLSIIIFSRNLINSIIILLIIFIVSGIYYLILGFDYLGFMFLIIYAGAIIILFIFVLMLIELKNFKNNIEIKKKDYFFFMLISIIALLFIIFNSNYIIEYFENLDNNFFLFLKYNLIYLFMHKSMNLNEISLLGKFSNILFNLSWFQTIFIGCIIIIALIIIIYLFKK